MDQIAASIEQMAQLTEEEKMSIIMPSAQLLLQRQKEKIAQVFQRRTGDLEKSLTLDPDAPNSRIVLFFKGKHRGSSTGKRKGKRGSNGKYSGSNAEVAYILNYGSPRIRATHWLDNANEEAEEEVIASQQSAWNDLLEKKGF
jgi:hypothetical protein